MRVMIILRGFRSSRRKKTSARWFLEGLSTDKFLNCGDRFSQITETELALPAWP